MRLLPFVTVGLVLVLGAGAEAGNLLANPSLEEGDKHPAGWACYGAGGQGWEVGAPEGKRYVSTTGDGGNESGWFATSHKMVESNRVYRVSFLVREETGANGGVVIAGLTRAKWQFAPSDEWQRRTFHFRSADLVSGLRFEMGQRQVDGAVAFDDVALYPSVAIYRCGGRGRYLLGDGESVVERRYTASPDPATPNANNYRFLYRASADYDGDRWVLDKTDMIVFIHQIEVAGARLPSPSIHGSVVGRTSTSSNKGGSYDIYEVPIGKPDESHLVQQEAVTVELDVPQCQGSVLVEMAPGPNGPWAPAKAIDSPGTYLIAAPKRLLLPSRTVVVRLASLTAKRVEVSGYRYRSMLVQHEQRDPVYGATHYVDVIRDSPALECGLVDIGELVAGGRNEASLKLANRGPRRKLVVAATVKRGSELVWREEKDFALGPGAETLRSLTYQVAPEGEQVLMLTARDAKTDELLLDLETEFLPRPARAAAAP